MKLKLSMEQKKLFETFLFLIKLLVFSIPLYVILAFNSLLYPLQIIVSQNIEAILNLMGLDVIRNGILFQANGFMFFISEDCTGWKSMLFLGALVFAVPRVEMKKRILGLAVGIPVIYLGNLMRILLMVSISLTFEAVFADFVHDWFWQFGLISLVLIIWILWLLWAGKLEIRFLKRFHKLIKPKVKS